MSEILKDKCILVVDDDVDLCDMLADEIEFSGGKVLKAHSGNQALQVISENHVDAVISDINMPDGDGFHLLKNVRSKSSLPTVVLLITGYSTYTPEDAYCEGADAVLSKPFDLEVVVKTIALHLEPIEKKLTTMRFHLCPDIVKSIELEGVQLGHESSVVNISRGGMFITQNNDFPKVGDCINFKVKFKESINGTSEFAGSGIVRWVRKTSDHNKRAGYGFEFVKLNEPSVGFLINYLLHSKKISYIDRN